MFTLTPFPSWTRLGACPPLFITHSWEAQRARWSSSQSLQLEVHPASWLQPGRQSTAQCPHPAGGRAVVPVAGD
jgi:hypothetical protein